MKSPIPIQWTPELITRFWDYWTRRSDRQNDYFASQHGREVVEVLSFARELAGLDVLDYGCGPGFLIPHLLDRKARVSAADSSPDSVEAIRRQFSGNLGFKEARHVEGSQTPWPDATFDIVCSLETIEHITEDHLVTWMAEIHRLLKPGGLALFTTPHAEPLDAKSVFCPVCESVFHPWQHIHSWTETSLSAILKQSRFEVIFCRGMNLSRFAGQHSTKSWKDWSPRFFAAKIRRAACRFLDQVSPRPFPNGRLFNELIVTGAAPHLVAIVSMPGREI
jgi:SAM-dependent methyltransferase